MPDGDRALNEFDVEKVQEGTVMDTTEMQKGPMPYDQSARGGELPVHLFIPDTVTLIDPSASLRAAAVGCTPPKWE